MLRSYLLSAVRALRRQKTYAAINVGGLALGIACCVLLLLYVQDELAHDRFHDHAGRIVRVNRLARTQGALERRAGTPPRLAEALRASLPEVEHVVRLANKTVPVTRDTETTETEVLFADTPFFEVFTFPLVHGDAVTALAAPDGLVLSAAAAQRLFPGTPNPVGEALTVALSDDAVRTMRVTGVAAPVPHASSIQFEMVLPFAAYQQTFDGILRTMAFERWDFPVATTFALLRSGADAEAVAAKATRRATAPTDGDGDGATAEGGGGMQVFADYDEAGFDLQPLTAIHLDPEVASDVLRAPSRPTYSLLLGAAALLVLLLACVNFTTLAVGRSASRAREVGVRKTLGARRLEVAAQFWGEALLTTTLALVLGLGLAALFLPTFNPLAGKALSVRMLAQPWMLASLAGLAGAVALVAGSYPALVLSRFEPVRVLKAGAAAGPGGRAWLMRALVAVQFALSIALVTGALVVHRQVQRLQTDLGFAQEQVVRIDSELSTGEGAALLAPFRAEARRHEAVQGVAGAAFSFFETALTTQLTLPSGEPLEVRLVPVTNGFVETLGVATLAATEAAADTAGVRSSSAFAVRINRTLARQLGRTPEEALGLDLILDRGAPLARAFGDMTVGGVVEDFHTRDLKHRLDPVVFVSAERIGGASVFYARLAPGRLADGLDHLRATWAEVAPERPFTYAFLDDVVAEAYETEQRWRTIAGYAAGFAVLVACIGMLGLAALAARQRVREIGIRKVLGASAASVVRLLSADFLRLVAVGFVLGAPLAYFGAARWLAGFPYRITLSPWLFAGAGLAVAALAAAVVGGQAYRAARADPASALRAE